MLRVPLPFRGVAVLLLAASTAIAQTPEPPAELPLDPLAPSSPEFLRQYSDSSRHPLLQFLVDGELTSLDETPKQKEKSPRLTPLPDAKNATPSTACGSSACEDLAVEIDCPSAPCFLPYACPPPPPPMCHCRKCQRQRKHAHGCGSGPSCGNPYLGWPGGYPGCYGPSPCPYQGCCSHKGRHKHGCGYGYGYGGYGYGGGGSPWGGSGGYGGGCGMMGCDGFLDGGCCGSCMPYMAPPPPPPPPPCFCRKCRKKYSCGQQGCGYPGYGSPWGGGYEGGYGGGYGMMGSCGGFMDGCCGGGYAPPPPPPCPCRKCQRKHGCSYGYGYAGCGYPGWPAYPAPGANMWDNGYNGFTDPNCFGGGCKHHHCHGRCHHCRGCHHTQPYPWYAYPQAMPCMMDAEPCCMDCGCGGDFCPALVPSGTCN